MLRTCSLARLAALAALAAAGALPTPAAAQMRPSPPRPGLLRVCADPDNMPLSNQKGEGFENKIAELIAREWNSKAEYAWWPVRRGFFARALNGRYCDIAIQAPSGLDMAAVTKAYYRSGYVFVTRKGSGLEDITSLADPRLKKLKIGISLLNSDAENTPPAMALSRYGVVGNLVGFSTFYTEQNRPEDIIEAVANKAVDVAIAWGPLAGYFAHQSKTPLSLVPLPERDSLSEYPFRFDIAMGVRRRDRELRDSLQHVLDARGPEIRRILEQYHVPLFPVQTAKDGDDDNDGKPAGAAAPAAAADSAQVGRR